uniref:Superkiller protein 3 n=1 Tax=Globisporangium ultimum (strain ATCC 200006 / CBS 805.95 / DAOM BR144) TaxID=431595 RepID=K3W7Y9_GLOUD
MSASMLRQMLEDAGAFLKADKFQDALDASRRVTQFDPNNFQAFMCVGMANFQLQNYEDSEEAYRRAAGLKPDLPAAWKSLVDLFDAWKQPQKKLEPLQKLVTIFQKNNKVKACQKWIAEVAATAMELKLFPKAFDAWYSLVSPAGFEGNSEVSLAVTPNEELPTTTVIWLDLVDLLQRPNFSLSDCTTALSIAEIADQFFAASARYDWASSAPETAELALKMDAAIAFFVRASLDALKAVKATSTKAKRALLQQLDAQALGIVNWFPTAKIPAEYLLLRSEDADSPITLEKAYDIAADLHSTHPKSVMSQLFRAFGLLEANETVQARDAIVEALAYCSSSSFHESSFCVRAQMELASIALSTRDIEGCLSRLNRAKYLLKEKEQLFGCSSPHPSVYSEPKVQLMEATAREYLGDFEKALESYHALIGNDDASIGFQATVHASELLLTKGKYEETLAALDTFSKDGKAVEDADNAMLSSIRGWVQFKLGSIEEGKALLETATPHISVSKLTEKAQAFKRLAIIYWHLDGNYRQGKQYCFGHLLQAAKLMPSDGEVFAWLGKYYQDVAHDVLRAEKCFLKALSLAPGNAMAGIALSNLYEQQGKRELNVKLWEDTTQEQVTAPTWALLRLAQHLVDNDDERAVGKLHLVLRNDPFNAQYWVTLGHVYRHFGKLVSAQKSYLKAIELGETKWCVMCELARIEGALLLFTEAFEHIEPLVGASSPCTSAEEVSVVSMLYAELLFKQAKYLCAEGLYGRAAGNLKRASSLMKRLSSSGIASSADGFKLIGDIHCFAFYLSPSDFDVTENSAESASWTEFISNGRKAYEAVAALSTKSSEAAPSADLAQVHYDVGVCSWYEAQALCTVHGIHFSGFEHLNSPRARQLDAEIEKQAPDVLASVKKLKDKARVSFRDALKANPEYGLAWNGLGVVHDHILVKQFAWVRAIQIESNESAWANLGMLYVHHPDAKLTASLAQKAFIHLQGVNADNPSMWNGYGMLSRREASKAEQQKAIEAFRCALEVGLDLDALQGFTTAILLNETAHNDEELLFAMRKLLERDPYNAGAWNALGVLQQRLGLHEASRGSFTNALSYVAKAPWSVQQGQEVGVQWNAKVALLGVTDSTGKDAFGQAIATVQELSSGQTVLLRVLKAQQLYYESDGKGSLRELNTLLQDNLSTSERDVVAVVGLSIAGLLGSTHPTEAKFVSLLCKKHLLHNEKAVTEVSKSSLHVVEMHARVLGVESECLSFLENAANSSDQKVSPSLWARLAFASIDFQKINNNELVSVSRHSVKKNRPGCDEVQDVTFAHSLVGLAQDLSDGFSAREAQKLVRMEPWNPNAYVIAGAALLKCKSTEVAALVAERGLAIAQSSSAHEFEQMRLHWLLCVCYVRLDESSKAASHCSQAHEWLVKQKQNKENDSGLVELELLDARVLSVVKLAEGIEAYHAALKIASSVPHLNHRVVPILTELGGVYEEANSLDCALQVWKFISTLTTSTASLPSVGYFLANLRLGMVHGKKQNTKTAKKQIKSAVALASTSEDSKQATVASFVESVIAKIA